MDDIIKGVKIGKLLGKDEKKETCKIIAIVVGVIAGIATVAAAAYGITSIRATRKSNISTVPATTGASVKYALLHIISG